MIYLAPMIAALCGAIVGSLLTSLLAHLATSRRELHQNRLSILVVLMGGRSNIFTDKVAESVNVIPILFHDKTAVRRAYLHFCAVPNGPTADLLRRYNEMVLAIATSLNFKDLTLADIDLGFQPSAQKTPAMEARSSNPALAHAATDEGSKSSP